MREHKKIERELISKGKKPFHIKKCKTKQSGIIYRFVIILYLLLPSLDPQLPKRKLNWPRNMLN